MQACLHCSGLSLALHYRLETSTVLPVSSRFIFFYDLNCLRNQIGHALHGMRNEHGKVVRELHTYVMLHSKDACLWLLSWIVQVDSWCKEKSCNENQIG